jgi:sec-independent protein translocase protein TatC
VVSLGSVVDSVKDIFRNDLPEDEINDEEMTILEHLEELRSRFIKMAAAVLICTAISFIFTPRLLEILKAAGPPDLKLVYIQVTVTWFTVALTVGIGLAMPVIVYQVIRFVSPGLTRKEKRLLFSMLPLIAIFFVMGATFGYFVTLPFAVRYLTGLLPEVAQATIRIEDYVGFATTILFAMGMSFELPVVIYTIAKLGLVTPRRLAAFRKYAILIFFVIAAIITPTPDPLNQTLVAAPMIVLYELGILMARIG